jgi:hypothetical protein
MTHSILNEDAQAIAQRLSTALEATVVFHPAIADESAAHFSIRMESGLDMERLFEVAGITREPNPRTRARGHNSETRDEAFEPRLGRQPRSHLHFAGELFFTPLEADALDKKLNDPAQARTLLSAAKASNGLRLVGN